MTNSIYSLPCVITGAQKVHEVLRASMKYKTRQPNPASLTAKNRKVRFHDIVEVKTRLLFVVPQSESILLNPIIFSSCSFLKRYWCRSEWLSRKQRLLNVMSVGWPGFDVSAYNTPYLVHVSQLTLDGTALFEWQMRGLIRIGEIRTGGLHCVIKYSLKHLAH